MASQRPRQRPPPYLTVNEPPALRVWSQKSRASADGGPPSSDHRNAHSPPPASGEPSSGPASLPSLSSPSFSARQHALDALTRALPALPAKDADAALAALDSAESELRAQRDAARVQEDAARDVLRRALQASSRARTAAELDAERADKAVAAAGDARSGAARALAALIEPLRVAKGEKKELCDARDLIAVLGAGEDMGVVRAAEVLANATGVLKAPEAEAIFDGDGVVLETARRKVGACVDDLSATLCQNVGAAVVAVDSVAVRGCVTAGRKLGEAHEEAMIMAAVEGLVAASEGGSVSPSSSRLFAENQAAGPQNRWIQVLSPRVAQASQPVVAAQADAVEAARDLAAKASEYFPRPGDVCGLAVECLLERLVIRACEKFLRVFEEEAAVCEQKAAEAEEEFSVLRKSMSASNSMRVKETHRACVDASKKLRVSRCFLLDGLVGMLHTVVSAKKEVCEVFGLTVAYVQETGPKPTKSTEYLERRVSTYLQLEADVLKDFVRVAFAEAGKVNAQANDLRSSTTSLSDAYERYRVSYVRVVSALPQMTVEAIRACQASFVRCSLACASSSSGLDTSPSPSSLGGADGPGSVQSRRVCVGGSESYRGVGPDSGGNDHAFSWPGRAPPVCPETVDDAKSDTSVAANALERLSRVLLDGYVAAGGKLLRSASELSSVDASGTSGGEMWSSGSSPIASYCKVVKFLFESNGMIDSFFEDCTGNPEKLSGAVENDDDRVNSDVLAFASKLGHPTIWRDLRFELRRGVSRFAADAQTGIVVAVEAAGNRLVALLGSGNAKSLYSDVSVGSQTVVSFSSGADHSYHVELEPSMPYVSACAFLEQQVAIVKSTLPSHCIEFTVNLLMRKTYEVILEQWRALAGPLSLHGGQQMTADGVAVLQVFGSSVGPDAVLNRLPALGHILSVSGCDLAGLVDSSPLSLVESSVILGFTEKRADATSANVANAIRGLRDSTTPLEDDYP